MAKRWNDDDDDLDIDIDFDRKEYMKKEITKGKSTLIAVGIAPVFSFVSRFVFNLTTDWLISFLAGLVGLVILSPLYKTLNIDVGEIGKKGWIKNGAVYAMTLLAVWVLLMNPPFGDYADPQVNDIQVEVYQGQEKVKPENINSSEDYNVTLRIKITSNSDIKDESVSIELDGESMDWEKDGDHHYVVEQENLQGESEHTLIISMEDVNGNENTVERSFTVQ